MIGVYVIPPLVFGMALFNLWLIHHFWLRHVFEEDSKPMAVIKNYRAQEAFQKQARLRKVIPSDARIYAAAAGLAVRLPPQPGTMAVIRCVKPSHSKGLFALNLVEEFTELKPSANILNMNRHYICGCASDLASKEL
jgi:hypothetical protein